MLVSARIKRRREELGLTQAELARRSGLTAPGISQYESGLRNPSFEALNKLSAMLGVSTDFLISGSTAEDKVINEIHTIVLNRIINEMTIEKRKQLLEYACYLSTKRHIQIEFPLQITPIEYSDYIFKSYGEGKLPVDINMIAEKLGINIIDCDLNGKAEGIFIRTADKPFILIEASIRLSQRKRFIIACLLSHIIIPWHISDNYMIRRNGTSSLHTDDIQEIEAQKFASYLLMPTDEVITNITHENLSLERIKTIAYSKFDVSLFALLNQLVDINKDRFSVVQSSEKKIKKVYQGNRLVTNILHENSIANSFFTQKIDLEEFRSGDLPANYWFSDASPGDMVHEESVYNPDYKSVLTLLDFGSCSKE